MAKSLYPVIKEVIAVIAIFFFSVIVTVFISCNP